MALRAAGVCYSYAADTTFSQSALADVSLSVEVGELVLVVGSTGSGKSTLLRLLAGLLSAALGTVSLDGQPLTASVARGTVGLVFQDAESQLFAETVRDDVAFGPRNLGSSGDRLTTSVDAALWSVGLDPGEYGGRSPFGLSGGEARRVALAGVLAMEPSYLLLDEPTAGLDARGRAHARDVVRRARGRAGVVVVSHTVEEFLGDADRVVVLAAGKVAFTGAAADVIADPAVLDLAGLRAPDVLRVQQQMRTRGRDSGTFTLDVTLAAERLARAGGWIK